MNNYDPKKIEPKWQKFWDKKKTFKAEDKSKKEKFYSLVEFPYPSGAGLHVGHPRPYTAMDVISRKKRMEGKNVMFPIGFDAFGLPTENYAIKTGRPPIDVTKENIANFTRQIKSLGFSFDWDRMVDTTDPRYFKWTQWLFLKFFEHGLAYKKEMPINWCVDCKIGLANEEVVDGKCERCGGEVEKRNKSQWMLAITKYADKLLKGLKDVDYIPQAKTQQENWIGKKTGINIEYNIEGHEEKVVCFTTRPDTNFGATFVVIGPEHELAMKITTSDNKKEVEKYIKESMNKKDIDRMAEGKEKTGAFTGVYAINSLTGYKMPIYIADYVLGNVGTGAVVGVPGHDKRDFEFAEKFGIEVIRVVVASDGDESEIKNVDQVQEKEGKMVNSEFLDGMDIHNATEKIMDHMEEKGYGKRVVNFKLRDWVFSRQRYWGEPIPLVNCEKCGWIPLPEKDLPLELPKVDKYEPTDTGESPLSAMDDWVNVKCPKCGGPAKRETDTMPNWAGSSWYFLRYLDPKNDKEFCSKDLLKEWMPVDWYNGGMEHTVLHLLYSRFWNIFFHDIGLVPVSEPYKKRTSHGMILASDGEKMSKSKGNVINPDDMVEKFGADATRTYIMFMGPFDQAVAWSTDGVKGVRRFLDKVWNLSEKLDLDFKAEELSGLMHKTIKKVGEDIEKMHFNTAISQLMIWVNELSKHERVGIDEMKNLSLLLSPFAPHMAEELWKNLGNSESISKAEWPIYDESKIKDDVITLAVQVNGKLRDTLEVDAEISDSDAKAKALESDKVKKWLDGNEPKKVIYVKGKLVSIVV